MLSEVRFSRGVVFEPKGEVLRRYGVYRPGDVLREQRPDGSLTTDSFTISDTQEVSIVAVGTPSTDGSTVVDGTVTTTVTDVSGSQLMQTVADVVSGLTLSSSLAVQTDLFNRPTRVVYDDGSSELTSYGCCGMDSHTAATATPLPTSTMRFRT